MALLFIDANIYLRFYDSSKKEFQKLLETLQKIKDSIFITKQIVDEVNRNKLDCFNSSLKEYLKIIKITKDQIPNHFDCENNKVAEEWNKKKLELDNVNNKHQNELENLLKKLSRLVAESEDKVSIILSELFSNAIIPSEEEVKKARARKELGNPPGKKGDPIGDELTWEQLLTKYKTDSKQEIWIVSNDSDFLTEAQKEPLLNPYLYLELKEISQNNTPSIRTFNNLILALTEYQKTVAQTNKIIDENTINMIKEEDHASRVHNFISDGDLCFICNAGKLSFSHWGRGPYGISALFKCNNCNLFFPSMETYD